MSKQILFVDDDQNLLDSFARILHNEFTIETAPGGKEGLALIHLFGPFAIVISVNALQYFANRRGRAA